MLRLQKMWHSSLSPSDSSKLQEVFPSSSQTRESYWYKKSHDYGAFAVSAIIYLWWELNNPIIVKSVHNKLASVCLVLVLTSYKLAFWWLNKIDSLKLDPYWYSWNFTPWKHVFCPVKMSYYMAIYIIHIYVCRHPSSKGLLLTINWLYYFCLLLPQIWGVHCQPFTLANTSERIILIHTPSLQRKVSTNHVSILMLKILTLLLWLHATLDAYTIQK